MKTHSWRMVIGLLLLSSLALERGEGAFKERDCAESSLDASTPEISSFGFNENGDIVYAVPEAIFIKSGRRHKPLVSVGESAPGTGGGKFHSFSDVTLNNVGTVAFKASIEGGRVGRGIFVITEEDGLRPLVLEGQIAPETRGKLSDFGKIALNDRVFIGPVGFPRSELVVFQASVVGPGPTLGLFFARVATQEIEAIALQGRVAEETGGGRYASFGDFSVVSFNQLPLGLVAVAFQAEIVEGHVTEGIFKSVLFPRLAEIALPIFLQGEDAPGPGIGRFAHFSSISFNRNALAFVAKLSGGEVPEAIFELPSVGAVAVPLTQVKVRHRGKAPDGGRFAGFGEICSNNNEQLVFRAKLEESDASEGLFLVTLGVVTLVTKVARLGESAPKFGGVFSSFGQFTINDEGRTLFQATLSGGSVREALFFELALRISPTEITR